MDGLINFPLFLISSLLIIIAPGPDFIYVTTRGISEGNKAGLLSALGISIGLLIHTLFAAFGLSAIIQASRFVYMIIKYIGAGYLIYIGIKFLLNRKKSNINDLKSEVRKHNVLKQGIITNVFNPKAIVTFMAFLPQFVDIKITNPTGQFITLGMILSIMAVLWFSIIGYFAGSIGTYIRKNEKIQKWISCISGSVMIILGLRLALKRE
jgi:threonine/homoserine/homoserine lactone efflux protein